jgi:tRNA-Thr(GGU) m(6)t(6)A37 methyltransferase TsaA
MSVASRIRSLFGKKPEPFPELDPVALWPIGVVRNGVKTTDNFHAEDVESRILLRPELEPALLGLDTWSHIQVLFWPHQIPEDIRGSKAQLHPRDDPENPLQGILATRSQIRFNPVLCTAVKLLSVKGNVVRVRGLDAIDGTPVLDIKPYVPRFDSVPEATMPDWVTKADEQEGKQGAVPER